MNRPAAPAPGAPVPGAATSPSPNVRPAGWASTRERGAYFMMRATFWGIRVFGRWVMLPIVHLVALYFFLFGRGGRRLRVEIAVELPVEVHVPGEPDPPIQREAQQRDRHAALPHDLVVKLDVGEELAVHQLPSQAAQLQSAEQVRRLIQRTVSGRGIERPAHFGFELCPRRRFVAAEPGAANGPAAGGDDESCG